MVTTVKLKFCSCTRMHEQLQTCLAAHSTLKSAKSSFCFSHTIQLAYHKYLILPTASPQDKNGKTFYIIYKTFKWNLKFPWQNTFIWYFSQYLLIYSKSLSEIPCMWAQKIWTDQNALSSHKYYLISLPSWHTPMQISWIIISTEELEKWMTHSACSKKPN